MPPPSKKLKILLGCYTCAPNRGSEPGVGWNFACRIAKFHTVHAIVEAGFKECINKYSQEHPDVVQNITFHFIPNTFFPTLRKIYPPSYYHFYRKWQKKAYEYAAELDKKENFDLVHQITLAGYREPGYLWKLGKPYVIGPLGGFTQTNWKLLGGLSLHGILFFSARNILNSLQKRFGFAAKHLSKHADVIIVSDNEAAADVKKHWHRAPLLMQEVGTQLITSAVPTARRDGEPLKVCWVGLLQPLKALNFVLHAIARCQHPVELNVVGSGEMEQKWKNLSQQLGITDKVIFHGSVPHQKVNQVMQSCHVLCVSSIKEGGTGTVVLEAMQNGLPIVCLDHCGFASVVNERIGIKIPITNRKQISKDFATALDTLYENEELRFQMSRQILEEQKLYSWDTKIKQLCLIYDRLLNDKKSLSS